MASAATNNGAEKTGIEAERAAYAELRASCTRHSAARFNELARDIARQLADGEDVTPARYLEAARILCSGQDYA